MRLHLRSDWVLPITFILASLLALGEIVLQSSLRSQDSALFVAFIIALALCIALAIVTSIFAYRGREIPDGSTFGTFGPPEVRPLTFMMSLFMLFAATGLPILFVNDLIAGKFLYALGVLGMDIFCGIFFVVATTAARTIVFTPQKTILIIHGTPFTYKKREHHMSKITKLQITRNYQDRKYMGDYIVYDFSVLYENENILLTNAFPSEVEEKNNELAKTLGVAPAPLPETLTGDKEIMKEKQYWKSS